MSKKLAVLFLGLGGTKIALGAMTGDGIYLSASEEFWRNRPLFGKIVDLSTADPFCDALTDLASDFLKDRGYEWLDVALVGVGFPGPSRAEYWYSNNLTNAFRRGVKLKEALGQAICRHIGTEIPVPIRVVFDAQCDAGGEVFHSKGRFAGLTQKKGTVLNIATGIAAGLVRNGRVLVGDEDFRTAVGTAYDGGSGQIGRHLWHHPRERHWEYRYCPDGGTPAVAGAVRMTDYLSGPALAARLLRILGQDGLPSRDWVHAGVTAADLHQLSAVLSEEEDISLRSQRLRAGERPFAGAVLSWADEVYSREGLGAVNDFVREVANELAAAIRIWAEVPGWAPYLRHIVLTGGAGIRLFASSDTSPGGGFLGLLRANLGPGTRIERSCLTDSARRAIYMFLGDSSKEPAAGSESS